MESPSTTTTTTTTMLCDDEILSKTNEILSFCELQPRFCSITDIQENSSSICVAILERLLQQKLSKINRNPKCNADYVQNARLFLDKLQSGFLKLTLPPFVTPELLCNGDKASISQILLILTKLVRLLGHVRANDNVPHSIPSPPLRSNYDADDEVDDISAHHQHSEQGESTTLQHDEESLVDLDESNVSTVRTTASLSCSGSMSSMDIDLATDSMTRSSTSMETDDADRSPIYRPVGFEYDLSKTATLKPTKPSTSDSKPRRKLSRKSSGRLKPRSSVRTVSRRRPASSSKCSSSFSSKSLQSVRSNMSALSSRSSSIRPQSANQSSKRPQRRRSTGSLKKKRKKTAADGVYRKILSPRLSLKHKNDALHKYSMKQSKLSKEKRGIRRRRNRHLEAYTKKAHLDEDGLIRIIKGKQREKTRADLRWLSKMEGELERELLLRTMRQKSEEQVAIERVQAEAKKLEKEYLRNYYREYKRKFEMLRNDLESKTQSISSFFQAQYNVLNEEKEALSKFHESRHYSEKVELSELKKELKSKKEAQLKTLCNMIGTLNLNDDRDLQKLNKMIRKTVGAKQ